MTRRGLMVFGSREGRARKHLLQIAIALTVPRVANAPAMSVAEGLQTRSLIEGSR